MSKLHKRRFIFVLTMVLTLATVIGLVLYALRQNINLFFTPTELAQQASMPTMQIRIGGMVQEGSITYKPQQAVEFTITDYTHSIIIEYQGILPDLFRAGNGVVALGILQSNGKFKAMQILAKHDEKYMPPKRKE